ncbi:MAG: hypothetical protein GY746_10800, partial [Gammaproteobacteria bacterium]|nr:hypothetical protein [Gammaproteobacteria bacterium]
MALNSRQGFFSRQGFNVFQGFMSGQGFNVMDTGIIFNGTYACYPLKNNGKDSITDAEAIVTRLSPKNYETTSGFKTVGDNEGAYTGEG